MYKKSMYVFTVLSVILSMLAITAPAAALGMKRTTRGTVVAVDSATQSMTVAPARGPKVKVTVGSGTAIKRNGKSGSFTDLHVGDKTSVTYNPSTKVASNVSDSTGQYEIEGTIEAVDATASTVTIASEEGGNSVVVNVDSTTVISLNGASVTLADLAVGDKAEAKYNSSTMLASSIKAETEDSELQGTVSAVDTTASTVTITPQDGSADIVLNVTDSTVIKQDDTVITLADLQVGQSVEAEYDSVSMVASYINVEDSQGNAASH